MFSSDPPKSARSRQTWCPETSRSTPAWRRTERGSTTQSMKWILILSETHALPARWSGSGEAPARWRAYVPSERRSLSVRERRDARVAGPDIVGVKQASRRPFAGGIVGTPRSRGRAVPSEVFPGGADVPGVTGQSAHPWGEAAPHVGVEPLDDMSRAFAFCMRPNRRGEGPPRRGLPMAMVDGSS